MMPAFFLTGLEGQSLEKLYQAFAENDIGCVIDIRLPRAFGLEEALQSQNELSGRRIGYLWLKYFGNPYFDRDLDDNMPVKVKEFKQKILWRDTGQNINDAKKGMVRLQAIVTRRRCRHSVSCTGQPRFQ